jgi:hypothetical protein
MAADGEKQMAVDIHATTLSWWHPIRKRRAIRKRRRQREQNTYAQIARDSSQNVRILCLPPAPRKASPQDWSRAAQLSAALAEREKTDGCAGLSQASVSGGAQASRWSAIVVPRSMTISRRTSNTTSSWPHG